MVKIARDVYRGLTEEELKKMPLEDFANLVKARSRRAILRMLEGTNVQFKQLIERVRKKVKEGKVSKGGIKTHIRDAVIIPEWLGLEFQVYNGKEWSKVEITIDKLGHRLGEYSYSTKFKGHSNPGIGATRGSKFVGAK